MAASLSIEEALSEWERWTQPTCKNRPRLLKKLSGGLTNESYLIEIDETRYRLRLNSPYSEELGINRKQETAILRAIAHLGITPALLYSDSLARYSIFEYVEGQQWTTYDMGNPAKKEKLEGIVRMYQAIDPIQTPRNYIRYLENYEKRMTASSLNVGEWAAFRQFKQKLEASAGFWPNATLCHHDLVPENIIESGDRLYILDWEYAAVGCSELDLLTVMAPSADLNPLSTELAHWLNTLWYAVQAVEK